MTNKHLCEDVLVSFMALHQVELSEELSLGSARRNARGCSRMTRHAKHKISRLTGVKLSFEMIFSGVLLGSERPGLRLS